MTFEITVPLRLLKHLVSTDGRGLVLDLCFRLPDPISGETALARPEMNSFSYSVVYGSDSLLPVHFVELNLQKKRPSLRHDVRN